jgi:hypothetical protein
MQEHKLLEIYDKSTKYVANDRGRDFGAKWKELQKFF